MLTCDYHDCTNRVRKSDAESGIKEGKLFCDEHGEIIDSILEDFDNDPDAVKKLMAFWIASNGGAKNMA